MSRSLAFALIIGLTSSSAAMALEARIAFPGGFADDVFLKSLTQSPDIAAAGLTLSLRKVADDAEAMALVKKGEADMAVFTLADADQKKLKQAGGEAQVLTRPFIFTSAQEVFLMQKSFLGSAATADAGRTGLLPLRIWNHAITYILTKDPVHSAADFARLNVAAENGAPDAKILAAVGAKPVPGAAMEMKGAFNAFETQLNEATRDFVARNGQKLYLTVGWPETGVLAAGPDFWQARTQAEKAAFTAALDAAGAASKSDLMQREDAMRANPNIEITRLDQEKQVGLAMMAAGPEGPDLHKEMSLWHRAEQEVHAKPAPMPAPKMQALSPVFFATDRNDEGGPALATRFGSKRLDDFQTTCGFVGAPARMSGEPRIPAKPQAEAKGVEACAKLIVEKTRAAGMKKMMFAIHGFNTDFASLLWRALQIGSDLDYDGAVVGWSWPSEGSAFAYGYDEDSNLWSQPHFAELVQAVGEQAPDFQIDLVAHSMGNRILLQTMRDFALAKSNLRIGAAIFAAPDVAQDVFRAQLRMAKNVGVIRTLYASQYDHAILISESLHRAPRAGSGGAAILVAAGIESVDALLSGHSYLFDESKAIADFRKVVNDATAAAARGLETKDKGGKAYWVIEP